MKLFSVISAILLVSTGMLQGANSVSEGPLSGMIFISIPAGEFLIGSDITDADHFDETPQRTVRIDPFEIMSTEVTQGMWEELMGTDSSSIPLLWTDLCGRGPDYPVYAVSWYDCRKFIDRLNTLDTSYIYRLPGEAEWEYACRAGTETDFFWKDDSQPALYCLFRKDESELANSVSGEYGTCETASRKANEWGLFDMAGNVSEWCQDRYSPDYDYLPDGGLPFIYPCDDQWPDQMNTRRVHRGGSWLVTLKECRSGNRSSQPPEVWATCIGFRLVRVPRTTRNTAIMFYHEGLDSIDADATIEGLELFTRALELNPTMIDALLYRGFFRYGIGETEESLADFNTAIELNPFNAGTYQMMGVVMSDAKYDQIALKVFNRVVELDPDYPGIYFHRGLSHAFLDNTDEAIADLTRAIVCNPGSPSAYFARGTTFMIIEQFNRALDDMTTAIECDPYYGDAYMLRGWIHERMGNMEQARADSIRAAEL